MKSIKEKALDVYPKMSRVSESHGIIPACSKSYYLGDANEEKREGFEAGANYVLEQIDKQLVEFSNFEDTLIISRIIKQLKSNQ